MHYGSLAAGIFFLLVGAAFFLEALGYLRMEARQVWPLLLIALGAAILLGAVGREESR